MKTVGIYGGTPVFDMARQNWTDLVFRYVEGFICDSTEMSKGISSISHTDPNWRPEMTENVRVPSHACMWTNCRA
jgi:hypothetical protein